MVVNCEREQLEAKGTPAPGLVSAREVTHERKGPAYCLVLVRVRPL